MNETDGKNLSTPAPDPVGMAEQTDAFVSALYRQFKEWEGRKFSADDVTWCMVRAKVEELLISRLAQGGQSWVSVDNGLPSDGVECLVWFDIGGGEMRIGIAARRAPWRGTLLWHGHGGSHNSVLHWQPLPKAPNAE